MGGQGVCVCSRQQGNTRSQAILPNLIPESHYHPLQFMNQMSWWHYRDESGIFPQQSPFHLLRALRRARLSLRPRAASSSTGSGWSLVSARIPRRCGLPAALAFSPAACLIAEPLLLG